MSRAGIENDVKLITGTDAIIVPSAWPAPEKLTDTATGQLVEGKLNQSLTIVRVGIKPGKRTQGGAMDQDNQAKFTLSQLRLICKEKADATDSLKGTHLFFSFLLPCSPTGNVGIMVKSAKSRRSVFVKPIMSELIFHVKWRKHFLRASVCTGYAAHRFRYS